VLEAIRYKRRHPQCRMIMDYHADYSNSGKNWLSLKILHGVIRKWYLDQARRHLSRIFPIVPASAAFLHEVYGVAHEEMELLPLGADTDLGEEIRARGDGPALRRSLGIPPEHTVIFSGGKLAPAKRTELLIEALNRLADPTLHLVIVGEASEADRAYQESLVGLARANSNIRFAGWLGRIDIYRHLAMADLAVFPASQSILWQQAISMGLPLIVGDAGHQDISYLNAHGNIIVLARQHIDSESLAAAIARVVGDRGLRRRMSEGALRVSDEMLNWNTLIDKTLRFNRAAPADQDQRA
jgi:glycosyltransferase involved in cell wall biosynthesis